MEPWHVAAALLSAVLHAGWNAAVKASPHPTAAMTAQMVAGAVLVLPGLWWTGLPAPASWPWIAASMLLNMGVVGALLRAYALGGFGVVYAVVRASSVLLVVPLAAVLSDEWLSGAGLVGVGLICTSLALLALGVDRQAGLCQAGFPPAALLWTLVAGAGTAAYVVCDAYGVRQSGSPWAYCFTASVANAVAMAWRHRGQGSPLRLLARHWALTLPVAAAAVMSYALILWVWTAAPVAPAAAMRDTSAVFGMIIAAVWLREPMNGWRALAIAMAAAGVPFLRLG